MNKLSTKGDIMPIRLHYHKKASTAIFFFLVAVVLIYPRQVLAIEQSIIEGARKERDLVVYSSMNTESANVLLQEFKKIYPFVNYQTYLSKVAMVVPKIEQETKSKRYNADVFTFTFTVWNDLKKKGLLMRYQSPESAVYPKFMKDPEDYFTILYLQVQGIAYNTNLVSANEAPKKYTDLLHARWKGKKIAMDYRDQTWFSVMLEIMGQEAGLEFMKKLSEQNLDLRDNKTLLANLLAAGEFPILANCYIDDVMRLKRSGAHLEWLPGSDPIPAGTHPAGIYAFAPHPNMAKLYIDFLLSDYGQKIIGGNKIAKFPARPDVKCDVTEKTKGFSMHPVNPAMITDYATISKQFGKIFWKH